MKQLNNNFTTLEQSKKLLELGVPADTADCYYEAIGFNNGYESVPQICSNANFGINVIDLPCWSVGRLMEIFDMCCVSKMVYDERWCSYQSLHENQTYLDYVIHLIQASKLVGILDFSKLED